MGRTDNPVGSREHTYFSNSSSNVNTCDRGAVPRFDQTHLRTA